MRRILLGVLLLLCARPAAAAVTFDANATAACHAAGATSINCSTLTVGAGTQRALVCKIGWTVTTVSAITLTWDSGGTNQAMTAITGATATGTAALAKVYGLVAPTSGAKTLAAAWTTASDVTVECTSWTAVDQTGGATTFPNGTGATGTSTTSSVTVTSAVGNAVEAVHVDTNAGCTCFTAVNNTQTFIDNTNADAAGNRAAGAATVTMTATISASTPWASAGTDILAAGAGAACTPTLTLLGVGRCG